MNETLIFFKIVFFLFGTFIPVSFSLTLSLSGIDFIEMTSDDKKDVMVCIT